MEKDARDFLQSIRHKKNVTPQKPYRLKLRNWLNTIFIVLAIVTIALYYIYPLPDGKIAIFTTGCIAVLIKTTEVTIRMTYKHTKK